MSSYSSIRRYYLLFEKVNRQHYPSFNEIQSYFKEHDIEISDRTLQRDVNHLRNDFGIEIAYDKNSNGYYIDNETSINPDVFLRFLEVVATAEMFHETLKDSKDTLKFIQFEAVGSMKGIEYLPLILKAIKDTHSISFKHYNFHSDTTKDYVIHPYMLKEYQNRWYVVGKPENLNEFRTFGIDRISELKILKTYFTRQEDSPVEYFENIVGLTWNPYKIEKVRFQIFKPDDKYIKTLPIHKSQQLVSETENTSTFEMKVVVNYELVQRFMMLGNACIVESPISLVQQLKGIIDDMKGFY
jgi:predicted DNA-binding transcriptional regulator YafY